MSVVLCCADLLMYVCSEHHAAILGLKQQQEENQEVSPFHFLYFKPEAEIILSKMSVLYRAHPKFILIQCCAKVCTTLDTL